KLIVRFCRRLQSPERHGHHIVVYAGNFRRADGRGEKASRIEHRRLLAHRHEADDEVPLQGKLSHEAQEVRFARAESAPYEGSLRLPSLLEELRAAAKRIEERVDQAPVLFPQLAYGCAVRNSGAQGFNCAARLDRRPVRHGPASVCKRLDSNRTRAASGLSRPVARTSSDTRIFRAS